jgi:hypothetical protein
MFSVKVCQQFPRQRSIVMHRYGYANRAIAIFSGFAEYGYASNMSQNPAMSSCRQVKSNSIAANVAQ